MAKTVVERRLVSQTVVHNHITQVIQKEVCPRRDTVCCFLPRPEPEGKARARPTLAAQRLVRLFSVESARRELQPFFHGVVREVLVGARERAQSRPDRETALIYHLFGEKYLIQEFERLRRDVWERPGDQSAPAAPRPSGKERDAPRLSGAEFQALVRGVERSLERRSHLDALRQGRA